MMAGAVCTCVVLMDVLHATKCLLAAAAACDDDNGGDAGDADAEAMDRRTARLSCSVPCDDVHT